jgi:hypothetical protein
VEAGREETPPLPSLPPELQFGEGDHPSVRWLLLLSFGIMGIIVGALLWWKAGLVGLSIGLLGVFLAFISHGATPRRTVRIRPGEVQVSKYRFFVLGGTQTIPAEQVSAVVLESPQLPVSVHIELKNGKTILLPIEQNPQEDIEEEVLEYVRAMQIVANAFLGLQPGISIDQAAGFALAVEGRKPAAVAENPSGTPPASAPPLADSTVEQAPAETCTVAESLNIEAELALAKSVPAPRRPRTMIDDYGLRMLKHHLETCGVAQSEAHTTGGNQVAFQRLARESARVAELQFALGYPLDRVSFFLQMSARAMCRSMGLRGTTPLTELNTVRRMDPRTGVLGPEEPESVGPGMDFSMGTPHDGVEAICSCLVTGDRDLASQLAEAIRFVPSDVEMLGSSRIEEVKAFLALLRDDEALAREALGKANRRSPRAFMLAGICEQKPQKFDEGLKILLEECEKNEASLRSEEYLTKGKKFTPPATYWTIEGMGLVCLAGHHGLRTDVRHEFLADELVFTQQ